MSASQKTTKYSPLKVDDVVKYFLWKGQESKRPITNKKLQKLLYYAQAWSVTMNDQPLFEDKIEAWVHGPVVRSVYNNFRKFGYSTIDAAVDSKELNEIPSKSKTFLDEIWRLYGKFDSSYLEMLTHSEEPWQMAREGLVSHEGSNNEITLESMKEYYSQKLQVAQEK